MRRFILLAVVAASLVAMLFASVVSASGRGSELAAVRRATDQYHRLSAALADGYGVFYVCTDQPGQGAMGQHYVNGALVGDAILDPAAPEAVIYEPRKNGKMRLVGVEWVVFKSVWEAAGNTAAPTLFGRTLKLVPEPNRYGIPAFYQLHAWIWKKNPAGSFSDWNPTVSCRYANGGGNDDREGERDDD
jgi:hypothetical protein